jgi:ubiquinone/menaquinone biosynthesis methyltransferase
VKVLSANLKSNKRMQKQRSGSQTDAPGRITRRDLASPSLKRHHNERLFTVVAPRYDCVTRILSFGRDRAWKRQLVNHLPEYPPVRGTDSTNSAPSVALDLACGTGDICFLLSFRYPAHTIAGLDLNRDMLRLAEMRLEKHPGPGTIKFIHGDMHALPFPSDSIDIVTGGYALRNAPDLSSTIREVFRVLKPGGSAGFLEFDLPTSPARRALQIRMLRFWGHLWGFVFHRDPEVYAYIARSLEVFPDHSRFSRMLHATGFRQVTSRSVLAGFLRITWMRKPVSP